MASSVVLGKKYRRDTLSNESSLRYPHMSHATVLWYSQHARDNFPSDCCWSYFAQQLGHTSSMSGVGQKLQNEIYLFTRLVCMTSYKSVHTEFVLNKIKAPLSQLVTCLFMVFFHFFARAEISISWQKVTDDGGRKRQGPPVEARNITDNKRVKGHRTRRRLQHKIITRTKSSVGEVGA